MQNENEMESSLSGPVSRLRNNLTEQTWTCRAGKGLVPGFRGKEETKHRGHFSLGALFLASLGNVPRIQMEIWGPSTVEEGRPRFLETQGAGGECPRHGDVHGVSGPCRAGDLQGGRGPAMLGPGVTHELDWMVS